ncbi:hypothetical protein D3C78_1493670 [compost metagenome]
MAVTNEKEAAKLCSKAIYWSNFTELVVREIKEGYNSDLLKYLNLAYQHANARHMESLIYATPTRA